MDVIDHESMSDAHRAALPADVSRPAGAPAGIFNSAA
jgi:hypothetical protein